MKDKNKVLHTTIEESKMVERDKFLDISYKIFEDFYAKILQDHHAHQFFNSYFSIEHLIKKQSETLYKIIKDIEEGRLQQAINDLETIAKRHFELGINYKVMFDFIDLYIKLLKDFKEELGVKYDSILELKEHLEHTTAKEYTIGLLESALNFVSAGNGIRTYSKYDTFFEKVIKAKIDKIIKVFKEVSDKDATVHKDPTVQYHSNTDNVSCEKPNIYLESHTECGVGKFLHGIGFNIMSFGNEKLRTETIAIHKVTHVLASNLVKYYTSKEYEEVVAIANSIVNSYYELIYKYEIIAKIWDSNREKLIPQILDSKKHKDKTPLLVISPSIELSSNFNRIIESMEDILQRYIENFSFIFFTKVNKSLYIYS